MLNDDNVSILLCSYNGEKYLQEQLDSIIRQTYKNWTLYISDDGSTDSTLNIISEYQSKLPVNKLVLLEGPSKCFAENFLSLIKNPDIQSRYYAFSDQDDIWLETKLEVAVDAVKEAEKNASTEFILYGGRTRLINEHKEVIGCSAMFNRAFRLENALLQSFSGGNTMLFNHALKLKIQTLPDSISIVSHDWYLYLICSAFGGMTIYDPEPQILYRQHSNNIVGSNLGVLSKIERLWRLYQGQFAEWNRINQRSLNFYYNELPRQSQKILDHFYSCRGKSVFTRIRCFHACRSYRQSVIETCFFYIMNAFGKLF
ncbi:glycosyltransferase family 2 protein [Erwinia tracheiphila]|uniref:Glycosyltransferase family 2 protein n=1 Tax=Erwinia tracheiphila TaxID=65700 RepID=A0A345CSE9_9GAMM|nr:glycosyltransferase family 2 protein [Erwinia tracheiphila]AXF76366.1 glycosyltransferase family 2 protein [Erwinia tracheiphila]UIA84976.1 glycosyltransferase family 2 protein [Erwinia tracheiphila]UIA86763.1 glycosyltransferase family 2 protein [Erwinia tracheiphila]UIA93572.1 glycosyltransferase family 2 protein [Erwinia tracheiphila]UIA95119.1 glycosyltransferase family 2 protein [Erwinia tracheiphila]